LIIKMKQKKITKNISWKIRTSIDNLKPKTSDEVLKKIARLILKEVRTDHLPLSNKCELGISITDDRSIKSLNKHYRGKNKPTDVLSFSMIEDNHGLIASPTLGDVVISLPTAIKQAKEYDVNLYQELLRLLIHGILHLLGFDHENVSKKEADRMRATEDRIYEKLLLKSKKIISEPKKQKSKTKRAGN